MRINHLGTACCAIAILLTTMGCNKRQDNESGYIGPSDITVDDGRMSPEVLLSLGRLSDPQISPDGTKVLYGVSYTSIADNRSCRNLFLSNIDGTDKVQLTRYAKSVSNARWSLDGKEIYFLQGGQIWKAPLQGSKLGKKVKISDVPAGISEFKLSPTQSNILYISSVHSALQTPVDSDPALDKAEAYATEDLMYRHWDHWVTETPRTYVAPFAGAMITPDNSFDLLGDEPYELPTEPFGGAEQLTWSPDGRFVAYSCRKAVGKEYAFSTDTEIYVYCILTGECKRIEMDGGYDTDPVWSPDGKRIAWLSMERQGYESDKSRIMVQEIAIDGNQFSFGERWELTSGFKYNAAGLVWGENSHELYFNALAEGLQAIYRADFDGDAWSIWRITGDSLWYDFDSPWAVVENDGVLTLLTSYCSMDFPNELVAVPLDGSAPKRITHENDRILGQLDDHRTEMRYVKTIDGKDMLTWVLYPPKFDESKKYPAIEICLGGPQGTLSQGWSYRWNYRLMCSQGYVVVLPNRRGTTAFGQEWCEQISGDYSGLNIQDYLSAARDIKAEPFIDKIAACGASYGGYSVYYLAGMHENTFDCFIAHAGIFDEEALYYTTEEMWFADWDNGGLGRGYLSGSPWSEFPEAVRHYAHNPKLFVEKWNTPILCIHGGMDFRIPYTQGMAAFNCAQMMGVPSKLVVFPEETHWILQPQNALYWHRTYFDWLERWIK
ncbi:MAG: S9 family peptidase [Bacteroidales bacterium]|nr:S9 family peptidase [Bacteroidales bacterium]